MNVSEFLRVGRIVSAHRTFLLAEATAVPPSGEWSVVYSLSEYDDERDVASARHLALDAIDLELCIRRLEDGYDVTRQEVRDAFDAAVRLGVQDRAVALAECALERGIDTGEVETDPEAWLPPGAYTVHEAVGKAVAA